MTIECRKMPGRSYRIMINSDRIENHFLSQDYIIMHSLLVIDDERSIRTLLKDFLTHCGYQVDVAKDGWEGIRLLNSGRNYCAVLTDVEMPEINGYDIANHVKKTIELHVPVLAITGMRDLSFKTELFDAVIQKPFDLRKLQRSLQSLLNFRETTTGA